MFIFIIALLFISCLSPVKYSPKNDYVKLDF